MTIFIYRVNGSVDALDVESFEVDIYDGPSIVYYRGGDRYRVMMSDVFKLEVILR